MKMALKQCMVHAIVWFSGYSLTVVVFSSSPCRWVYGIVVAWWASLYVGRVAAAFSPKAIPAAIGFSGVLVAALEGTPLKEHFFGHDHPALLAVLIYSVVFFSSPIVVNLAVGYFFPVVVQKSIRRVK